MIQGDFTGVAEDYERYRTGYSPDVLRAVVALLPVPAEHATVADVGAGTGKWTRQVAAVCARCVAIEPNDDMRRTGGAACGERIVWRAARAEETGEPDGAFHWVTMASSFHWTDAPRALSEFRRILVPDGLFTCLWNPRVVTGSPLLEEIERHVSALVPPSKRRSSGSAAAVQELCSGLTASGEFTDMISMEATRTVVMTPEQYLGAWRSTVDIRAQAGDSAFAELLRTIEQIVSGVPHIECPYLTRAWTVRRAP